MWVWARVGDVRAPSQIYNNPRADHVNVFQLLYGPVAQVKTQCLFRIFSTGFSVAKILKPEKNCYSLAHLITTVSQPVSILPTINN